MTHTNRIDQILAETCRTRSQMAKELGLSRMMACLYANGKHRPNAERLNEVLAWLGKPYARVLKVEEVWMQPNNTANDTPGD